MTCSQIPIRSTSPTFASSLRRAESFVVRREEWFASGAVPVRQRPSLKPAVHRSA